MDLLDLDSLELLFAQCPKEMPSVYDAPAFSAYLVRWQRYTSALEAAAPALIAAARRELEARALLQQLSDETLDSFCCGDWPNSDRAQHAPDCPNYKAQMWLAQGNEA